jgi:hypothetical protein
MPCSTCQTFELCAAGRRPHGGFNMLCARCCARLVRSARPLRMAQEAMLACIARHPGAPTREAVLQALKALDAP